MANKLIVIVGPTAAGKSALAHKLASQVHGQIVNADSRSIYRGVEIGTAAPSAAEQRAVPHHLFGIRDVNKPLSLHEYLRLAKKTIARIEKAGTVPILVGGSALYINALIYNYKLPPVEPNQQLRRKLEKQSLANLVASLVKLSPEAAERVDLKNKRRVIRALEIVTALGYWPRPNRKELPTQVLLLGINPSERRLRRNIARRAKAMIGNPRLARETKRLIEAGRPAAVYSSNIYPLYELFLDGQLTREQLEQRFCSADWQLARRQMTWFKRDRNIIWVKNARDASALIRKHLAPRSDKI